MYPDGPWGDAASPPPLFSRYVRIPLAQQASWSRPGHFWGDAIQTQELPAQGECGRESFVGLAAYGSIEAGDEPRPAASRVALGANER